MVIVKIGIRITDLKKHPLYLFHFSFGMIQICCVIPSLCQMEWSSQIIFNQLFDPQQNQPDHIYELVGGQEAGGMTPAVSLMDQKPSFIDSSLCSKVSLITGEMFK